MRFIWIQGEGDYTGHLQFMLLIASEMSKYVRLERVMIVASMLVLIGVLVPSTSATSAPDRGGKFTLMNN